MSIQSTYETYNATARERTNTKTLDYSTDSIADTPILCSNRNSIWHATFYLSKTVAATVFLGRHRTIICD